MGGAEDYTASVTNVYGSGGYGTNPTFQWTLTGINANKFALTNATSQVCTIEYIGTGDCGGGGHPATLNVTVSGYNLQGQSISPVADTMPINGCDDTSEGGSS